MSELDRAALSWLRTHHATIPTSELAGGQRPIDRRKRLVRAGVLERVVDGAYAFSGVEPDELARCAALCTSRPHVLVTGPTVGRLWELRRSPRDGIVHVLAPPASHPCREPSVRAYRTAMIFDDEIAFWAGSSTTVGEIAAQNVHWRECRPDSGGRVGRLSPPPPSRASSAAEPQSAPGRVARSARSGNGVTPTVARGVRGLQRQVEVKLPGYGRARFDLAIPDLAWAFEVDVHPEHRTWEGAARDSARDDAAEAIGWLVRRVTEMQLEHDFAATLDDAVAAIARRRVVAAALRAAGAWPSGRDER